MKHRHTRRNTTEYQQELTELDQSSSQNPLRDKVNQRFAEHLQSHKELTKDLSHLGKNDSEASRKSFSQHPREYYKRKKAQSKRSIIADRKRKETGAKKPLDAALDKLKDFKIEKGENGDHKEEGYKFTIEGEPSEGNTFTVHAENKRGSKAGYATFHHRGDHLHPADVEVSPAHRRKGIASGMYSHAEKHTSSKIKPSKDQSHSGKALWSQKNKPFGKSENLHKGENGEWKKEGYSLENFDAGHGKVKVVAKHPDFGYIASATFHHNPDSLGVNHVHVEEPHRRKGLASAMYEHAQNKYGKKIERSPVQSPNGFGLWNQPNRPFGKTEFIDEEDLLEKNKPQYEGEKHPSQPWEARTHSLGETMWSANKDQAAKIDNHIRNKEAHQQVMSKLPETHRQAYVDMVNSVGKDPDRHFIPSQHGLGGEQKVRARHLKSLLIGDNSVKLDSSHPDRLTFHRQSHTKGSGDANISIHFPINRGPNEKPRGNDGRGVNALVSGGQRIQKSDRKRGGAALGTNRMGDNKRDLAKGSLQRRNKFNPHEDENKNITSKQRLWTHDEEQDHRDTLPKMEGSARLRALNKLSAKTHVRKDPSSGERMFLMHRGMGNEEFTGANKNGVTNYENGTKTSWTPDLDVARNFGGGFGSESKVVSAWIPESAVHHSPNQFNAPTPESIASAKEFNKPSKGKDFNWEKTNGPNKSVKIQKQKNRSVTEREEQEWIVNHRQPFHHAHPDFVTRIGKDQRVSDWKTHSSSDQNFKASIGAKQFGAVQKLQPEDKGQAHDNAINAKSQIGINYKQPKTKKLAASENTKPDLKKHKESNIDENT